MIEISSRLRAGSPSVIEKLDRGEAVDLRSYYFRMNPLFETSSPKYDCINRIIAIGTGPLTALCTTSSRSYDP